LTMNNTLIGRYRRGKSQSSDVDIVFCPPYEGDDAGLLRDLTRRMGSMGIITHVLREFG
jgi:DNA polymerase mu